MPISVGLICTRLKVGIEVLVLFQGRSTGCWRGGAVKIGKSNRFFHVSDWLVFSQPRGHGSAILYLKVHPHSHSVVWETAPIPPWLSFEKYLLISPSHTFSRTSQLSFSGPFHKDLLQTSASVAFTTPVWRRWRRRAPTGIVDVGCQAQEGPMFPWGAEGRCCAQLETAGFTWCQHGHAELGRLSHPAVKMGSPASFRFQTRKSP